VEFKRSGECTVETPTNLDALVRIARRSKLPVTSFRDQYRQRHAIITFPTHVAHFTESAQANLDGVAEVRVSRKYH
jgi:hypothetical protein